MPYLRDLAALVALGTTGSALADYALRAEAVSMFGSDDHTLLRFFAVYYAAISMVTFTVQVLASRSALERFGLGVNASTPSAALLAGGMINIIAPGLASIVAARGGESVFRGSLFRASYEVFYTPMARGERRAAKSIIDVGFDRLGEAAAGVWLLLLPAVSSMWLAMGMAAATLVVATRLNRGYVNALERSLLEQKIALAMSDIVDRTTRTTMMRTLTQLRQGLIRPRSGTAERIEALRSRDRDAC